MLPTKRALLVDSRLELPWLGGVWLGRNQLRTLFEVIGHNPRWLEDTCVPGLAGTRRVRQSEQCAKLCCVHRSESQSAWSASCDRDSSLMLASERSMERGGPSPLEVRQCCEDRRGRRGRRSRRIWQVRHPGTPAMSPEEQELVQLLRMILGDRKGEPASAPLGDVADLLGMDLVRVYGEFGAPQGRAARAVLQQQLAELEGRPQVDLERPGAWKLLGDGAFNALQLGFHSTGADGVDRGAGRLCCVWQERVSHL